MRILTAILVLEPEIYSYGISRRLLCDLYSKHRKTRKQMEKKIVVRGVGGTDTL